MAYRLLRPYALVRPGSSKIARARRVLTKCHSVKIETKNPTTPPLGRRRVRRIYESLFLFLRFTFGRPAGRLYRGLAAADRASAVRRPVAADRASTVRRPAAVPAFAGRPVADPAFDRCLDCVEYFRSD